MIYTLLGTADLNGINPQLYLRHVLARIADHPINRIDELLPLDRGATAVVKTQAPDAHRALQRIERRGVVAQAPEQVQGLIQRLLSVEGTRSDHGALS